MIPSAMSFPLSSPSLLHDGVGLGNASSSVALPRLSMPLPVPAQDPSQPNINVRSCRTCRRRKVRCDKTRPCSNCVRAGAECAFPAPGRAPRKRTSSSRSAGGGSGRSSDAELLARLSRLEAIIGHLKKPSSTDENARKDVTPSIPLRTDVVSQRDFGSAPGRLVADHGRSRYVSNPFWTSLGDEVSIHSFIHSLPHACWFAIYITYTTRTQIEEVQDLLDPPSSDEDSPSPEQLEANSAFLFSHSLASSLRPYQPSPSQAFFLWGVYEERVAPVFTLLHTPTARRIVLQGVGQDLDKTIEALVFAIYFAAIITLSSSECLDHLHQDKDAAVSQYQFAVEQALGRADFLKTQSVMLVQASCIFLFAVHAHGDTRFVWSIIPVLIRVGQGLGLHRDGSNFGLDPFETEMRRRLWWYV